MANNHDVLFTPIKVGSIEIKNRIFMAPLGGMHLMENNVFNKKAAATFIERAKGGVGLMFTGSTCITDRWGRGGWHYEGYDNFVEPCREMMKVIHSYGSRLFVQVTAGNGRNLFINNTWDDNDDIGSDEDAKVDVDKVCKVPRDADLVNAMNAPADGTPNFWDPSRKHRGLTKKEIHDYVVAFGKTAKMLQDGDVDGIEIHSFHEGYLLDEFSIANTNMRTDEYGGSLENRARFMCEIIREVKRVCGEDFPVSVRYSVASKMKAYNQGALPGEPYVEFGRSLEESPALARILQDAGCDLLNCDNGSYEGWYWAHPPMYMPKNCNMLDAVYLKQFVDIPVSVSGRMQEVDVSANAIADHKIDAITIGRQLLADPDWPTKVKEGRLDDIRPCISCHNGCFGRLLTGKGTSCAINPAANQEEKYRIIPTDKPKKIIVVGGGIGGMEASRVLTMRGHKVSLYEKTDRLGGTFIAASAFDFKDDDRKLIQWYIREVKRLNVDIHMNTEVTAEMLADSDADSVIIATGPVPKHIPIPGVDRENVITALDYLLGRKSTGDKVAVIGGGLTGCEIAYDLAKSGKDVCVVEMNDDILQVEGLCGANSMMLRDLFKLHNVKVYTSAKLTKITETGISITMPNSSEGVPVDTVIMAVGFNPDPSLAESIKAKKDTHIIGDAIDVGNLLSVVWGAYDIAMAL